MDKNALMQKMAREAYARGSFNGAWLYAEGGEIVSKGAMGFCDPAAARPITEDTVFQLASVTKQFTAAAVMLLRRQGLLTLEDEITRYFPDIPCPGVTIRRLLSHTGGVPDYFDDDKWFTRIWREEHRVPGNQEILRFLRETEAKPYGPPGEQLAYSNTGYNLLALLVERLSGVPFEDFLRDNLFVPAGMTSTRCCHIRRDGVPFANFARAMVLEDGKYVADVDSEEYGDVTAFDGLNGDDYVYSTIFDMLRWDRALREGKVLTHEEQQLMYTPATCNNGAPAVYDEEECLGYGFGWAVGRSDTLGLVVSHSGGMPGVNTWFERWIDADRTLIMLCSRDPMDYRAGVSVWDGMRDVAWDREPGPIRSIEEIAVPDPDKSRWDSFCGSYQHVEDEDFIIDSVWMEEGELYAKAIVEGRRLCFRLYPLGDNTFGRKNGMLRLTFSDGGLQYSGHTCQKI